MRYNINMSVIALDKDWAQGRDGSADLVQMRQRVEQLADALAIAKQQSVTEAYRQVRAQFSDGADSDLGQLTDLLLKAYHAYRQQRQLDEIRSGRYSADPRYEHIHKDQLRYALCEY